MEKDLLLRERGENQFGLVWFCLLEMVMCASSETTFLVLLFKSSFLYCGAVAEEDTGLRASGRMERIL